MDGRTLLDFLALAEKMKCHTRHSWTSSGRKESVAEHTYRMMVFAWLVKDEFPEYDMDRVMTVSYTHLDVYKRQSPARSSDRRYGLMLIRLHRQMKKLCRRV